MVSGPHVFAERSEVAIKHRTNGQSTQRWTARVCPLDLRQRLGVLPDADLDMDRFLGRDVADTGHKRMVRLGSGFQALEISSVADDQLHGQLHPRLSVF